MTFQIRFPAIVAALLVIVVAISLPACIHSNRDTQQVVATGKVSGPTTESRHAVVVSVSRDASEVGRDVLMRGGGNAVDAAVATAFALAVTYPEAGNIGGGGFMLIRPADGRSPAMIDYREMAPAAATAEMFDRATDRTPARLVGVPGTVRGLAMAHERCGR